MNSTTGTQTTKVKDGYGAGMITLMTLLCIFDFFKS